MITAIARRLRHRDDEAGITLIELLVSTMLGTLILIAAGALMISTSQSSAVQASSDLNARGASTAMNTMSRYFHAATTYPQSDGTTQAAFVTMTATDVTFYAYVNLVNTNAQPVKVRYFVDATTKHLIEWLYPSTCTGGYCTFGSSYSKVDLGGPVVSPTSDNTSLFVYLNAGGSAVTDPASVQSVQINLEYGGTKAGTPGDTHLSNTVALLNVGQFGGDGS
jgi:Tfp pilus assembly protein PilE